MEGLMSRVFAVGDIHGMGQVLEIALTHLGPRVRPFDTVVFLGDYIDRGPESAEVIQQLQKFKKKHRNTIFLRGNHEQMLMEAFVEEDQHKEMQWLTNGGHQTLISFKAHGKTDWRHRIPQYALDFFNDTEMEYLSERFHFVHAGVLPPGVPSGLAPDQDIRLWVREAFINSSFTHQGRVIVFGHTIIQGGDPLIQQDKVGIDTGACTPNGRLTVACFNDLRSRVGLPQFDYIQVLANGAVVEKEVGVDELVTIAEAPDRYVGYKPERAPAKRPLFQWLPKAHF